MHANKQLMRIGPYTKIPWLGRFSVNNNLNFILFLTWSYCIVGVREKIDSPMHRDSLFNDSEYFKIDSELVLLFLHIARVC